MKYISSHLELFVFPLIRKLSGTLRAHWLHLIWGRELRPNISSRLSKTNYTALSPHSSCARGPPKMHFGSSIQGALLRAKNKATAERWIRVAQLPPWHETPPRTATLHVNMIFLLKKQAMEKGELNDHELRNS